MDKFSFRSLEVIHIHDHAIRPDELSRSVEKSFRPYLPPVVFTVAREVHLHVVEECLAIVHMFHTVEVYLPAVWMEHARELVYIDRV